MRGSFRRAVVATVGAVGLVTLMVASATAAKPGGGGGGGGGGTTTRFGAPVKVTPTGGGGYEPGLTIDKFGNIFATAHKENWQLVLGPDLNSPTFTRSMSWDWMSADNGATWKDIPGLTPASLEQHQFGDEGDMALDDASNPHLYFVDTSVTDVSITRWTTSGLDKVTLDFTRPLLPAAQPVDDRPWVIAHGGSSVFYFGNEGDKVTYTSPQQPGTGWGPGRYTVYRSYDGGQTFDIQGYTLNDSGWCRPAADHTPGSKYVYVICTNDGGSDDFSTNPSPKGTLWAYVSADDGHTFSRYKMGGYTEGDPNNTTWPSAQVAPDGSIWALFDDRGKVAAGDDIITNKLRLFHSTNHGQTWSAQDITPLVGKYVYSWISVSPNGLKLGLGTYFRPDANSAWYVYGSIFSPGSKPTLVALDPKNAVAPQDRSEPPADFMESAFGPDGHLSVIWTRVVLTDPTDSASIFRDIYFARSL